MEWWSREQALSKGESPVLLQVARREGKEEGGSRERYFCRRGRVP